MSNQAQTDLTTGEVDSLLADFRWLAKPPALSLPLRDERLWRQAVDEAWKADRTHAQRVALAASVGGQTGAVMDDLKTRQAIRAAVEKQTGKPSTAGLSHRFRDEPERIYRRLDPAYAKAEAEATRARAGETAAVRKRADLLLLSVKTPLLQRSELAAGGNAAQAWSTYQAAIHQSKPDALAAVVQDLERIKAKTARQEASEPTNLQGPLAEVAACLRSAPGGDCTTDQVKAWLFTSRNCVAVRVSRILQDKAARELLTDAAARTWRRVTDPEGKAQRLWARLNSELVPLATSKAKLLQRKAGQGLGVLANLFAAEYTCHDAGSRLWDWTRKPLAIKADLIFPYHRAFGLLPIDKAAWKWAELPHGAPGAVRVPPIGDFLAAMVMNRLGMVVSLTQMLRFLVESGQASTDLANWHHALGEELRAVRCEIWDTPDAQERAGALALLQAYLALEEYRPSFEADWSVIPWPAKPENLSLLIYDNPDDKALFAEKHIELTLRHSALGETFREALKTRPGEVGSIVKGGLEWLAGRTPATAPKADRGEQPKEKAQDGDKPDETGLVKNPLDPSAYRGATRIPGDFPENAPTYKDLTRILADNPQIRRWKPSPQRLSVHLGDWQKYVDSKSNTSRDGWLTDRAAIQLRKEQVRRARTGK